jgi:putative transposase
MLRIHANRKVYNNAIAYLNQHQGKFTDHTVDKKTNQPVVKTSGKQAFRSFCKTLGLPKLVQNAVMFTES